MWRCHLWIVPALPGSILRTNLFRRFQQPRNHRHRRDVLQHLSFPFPDYLWDKAPDGTAARWTKLLGILRSSVDHDHSGGLAFLRNIFPADRAPMYGSGMATQAMETRTVADAVRGTTVTILAEAASRIAAVTMSDVNALTSAQPSRNVAAVEKWTNEPTTKEIFCLAILFTIVFALVIFISRITFATVRQFRRQLGIYDAGLGDKALGLPRHRDQAILGLAIRDGGRFKLTGLSDRTALLLCSVIPSLLAAVLAKRLWDGWIAGYFRAD